MQVCRLADNTPANDNNSHKVRKVTNIFVCALLHPLVGKQHGRNKPSVALLLARSDFRHFFDRSSETTEEAKEFHWDKGPHTLLFKRCHASS